MRKSQFLLSTLLVACFPFPSAAQNQTRNVILITLDGARSQEMFGGLDLEVLKSITREGRIEDAPLYKDYWAPTPAERRQKVMPFFWGTLMRQYGSIAGDRALGSTVQITNAHRFSYPGYSEILTGEAHDEVIDSNDRKRNPYTTVLEFLKSKLGLNPPQVACFASWDVMGWIAAHNPAAISVNAGYAAYDNPEPGIREMSRLQFETVTPWDGARHDTYTFHFALAHLKRYQPRVLYISLDETDDWAHDGRYDRVLQALGRTDNYLRELWEFIQSSEQYRGKTTILITADHGRGDTSGQWRDHGRKIPDARYIWLAAISPDAGLRGEWANTGTIYQNQIAATMCRFLNLDYSENNPNAGKPIMQLFGGR